MEKYYSNVPPEVIEELDRQMDRNPRLNIDQFYRERGILPIHEAQEVAPNVRQDQEQKMARTVLRALNMISGGNKTKGMINAEDELHPNVAHIDPSVIAAGRERLEAVYGRAENLLRRSIGSQALKLVAGEVEVTDNTSYVDLIQDRLYGDEVKNERAKVRRNLKKLAGLTENKKTA